MENNYIGSLKTSDNLKHILKIMRTTLFFLFFSILISTAADSYSQKFNLAMKSTSIKEVCREIEQNSNYIFVFSDNVDERTEVSVDISVSTTDINEILDLVLSKTGLTYSIIDKQIVVYKSDEISSVTTSKNLDIDEIQQSTKKRITGKVIDAEGETVIGANVIEVGTTNGTVTDIDGNFSLQVDQNANVRISFIGYIEQTINTAGKTSFKITLLDDMQTLEEVVVVGYGTQQKATLTGAISSIDTEALTKSPNASVANVLAGKVTGISSVANSGQPGLEDPAIYVRGVGSLTSGASRPLILVDGVERSFMQMDPNEIESISVLKDASATAVFGVRGANGVIMVTTKRGKEGKARISVTSSAGIQMPTRVLETADSYTYSVIHNEMQRNDNAEIVFSDYVVERFRLKDEPILFPDMNWTDYIMNKSSFQTQHNVNISGGTNNVKYFVSTGLLYQNGLFKQFDELDYDNNYKYRRYNYRANLDLDITKTTTLNVGIGGIIGNVREPYNTYLHGPWYSLLITQPFAGPGIIDGKLIKNDNIYFPGISVVTPLEHHYGRGTQTSTNNRANFDICLNQNLDFVTKGLSFELKGAYNTTYQFNKEYQRNIEIYRPYYSSTLNNPGMDITNPDFDKTIIYRVDGINSQVHYRESNSKARDWYFESSMRYNNKFGNHNVGGMLLYTQNKRYYPSQYPELPTAYIGLVGRITYDYKTKYLAEFNIGYNGSENFAPGKRFGIFPAGSFGYVLTEEDFMKDQNIIDYLKLRASFGLVGNDNIGNNRYLYLQDTYNVDIVGPSSPHTGRGYSDGGYNFGYDSNYLLPSAREARMGNPNITWEKSLKQNIGIDFYTLNNRLKITADYFTENRKDILINRSTIPVFTNLNANILPVVNMGKVDNRGYEVEVEWNDKIEGLNYWINANMSYAKNKIIFMDEVEPNEEYMARTGRSVGEHFGYVANGFFNFDDFDESGNLLEGFPDPGIAKVYPGDINYKDLNNDGIINSDDQTFIGNSAIPEIIFGLNHGFRYKGFSLQLNWLGATNRDLLLVDDFRKPFRLAGVSLFKFHVDERWTPQTAETATFPRLTANNADYNYNRNNSLFIKDGSYIRLKNATIGYELQELGYLSKLGISKLTINLTGYNLITFDKFGLIDPENTPTNTGYAYPITKMFNLGLNINF